MSDDKMKHAYEDTAIAKFIRERIEELKPIMSQREIAAAMGYEKANVLSMYKRGEAKVPLGSIPDFAKALRVDPALLFKLGLAQWWPNGEKMIEQIFSKHLITENEREFLAEIENLFGPNAKLTPKLKEILQRLAREDIESSNE